MLGYVFSYLNRWFKSQNWCMVEITSSELRKCAGREYEMLVISVSGLSQEESASWWCVCGSTEKSIMW